jgi:hypothetical protein
MRNAPSVILPVGRSLWGRAAAAVPVAASGLALVAWAIAMPRPWSSAALAQAFMLALTWIVAAVVAWRHAARAPTGVLRWEGRGRDRAREAAAEGESTGWTWWADGSECGEVPVRPAVMIDLQQLLVVRLEPVEAGQAGRRACAWLWLTPEDDPARWWALRRGLYAFERRMHAAHASPAAEGP